MIRGGIPHDEWRRQSLSSLAKVAEVVCIIFSSFTIFSLHIYRQSPEMNSWDAMNQIGQHSRS